jgi:hypothetical protein
MVMLPPLSPPSGGLMGRFKTLDLTRGGFGQIVYEFNPARIFINPAIK